MNELKNKLKIEAEIYEVKAGEVIQLKIDGQIFSVTECKEQKFAQAQEQFTQKQLTYKLPKVTLSSIQLRGPIVGRVGHNNIFKRPLEMIKQNINVSPELLKDDIKKYYPDAKDTSLATYISAHKRFIRGESKERTFVVDEDGKFRNAITKEERSRKKRIRRRKPKDALGFDKTYKVWVREEDVKKVKTAVHKWGFKATTDAMVKITGLSYGRVRATAHYLAVAKEISTEKEGKTVIYIPKKVNN